MLPVYLLTLARKCFLTKKSMASSPLEQIPATWKAWKGRERILHLQFIRGSFHKILITSSMFSAYLTIKTDSLLFIHDLPDITKDIAHIATAVREDLPYSFQFSRKLVLNQILRAVSKKLATRFRLQFASGWTVDKASNPEKANYTKEKQYKKNYCRLMAF